MSARTRILLSVLSSIAACWTSVRPGQAAPITWIGGNANWDALNANWNPNDEPDANDEAIFNTPNTVDMANAADTIQALTLSGGIDLDTNSNDLNVNGLIQLTGASTNFFIGGSGSTVTAEDVTINADGVLRLTGGTLTVVEPGAADGIVTVVTGGTLAGNGTINLNDSVAAAVEPFVLSGGTLSVSSNFGLGDPFGAAAATLFINVGDVDGRVDLDNLSADVFIARNDTLDINGQSHGGVDPYSGTLNLAEGATIDMSVAWEMDTGVINANTGSPIVGVPGAAATIAGAAFSMMGGTINLDAIDSLQFSSPFHATGGVIANAGHVIFNANSTVGAGADFQMTGADASITVNAGVTANIDDPDFDAGAIGAVTNVLTINSGGILDLDLGAGADESLSGVINLNGGELDVTTIDANWSIDGDVNVGAVTGTSQINGSEVTITNNLVTVGANSTLDVNADSVWTVSGDLVVNAGGVARLDGTTTFNNAATFTGAGTLRTGGNTTFATATTINMPAGTVDLDGADFVGNTVTVNANTTINVDTMASFGFNNFIGTDMLVLNNFASLTVTLTDPNDEWTLTADGVLDINAVGGMLGGSGIQGSDFNMAGTAAISGNSIWGARTDISGTATVAAAGSLNLRGGDLTDANVNRLVGGTIAGDGSVRALTNEGLFGFGTIDADVEFANNTELRADDGILNVNAPIVDVGVIGTADDDGILNVTTAWNTNVVNNEVRLEGGEIRGATITNTGAGGINGFGLVSSRVINTNHIDAEDDETLVLETALNNNDWDGALNIGSLRALTGDLEIRDTAAFPFTGTVFVQAGREVFTNGFALDFDPGAAVNLTNGTYRSSHATNFGGGLTVSVGGDSRIAASGTFTFENGSITTLNDNLRLANSLTVVEVGAMFAGPGALINVSRLQLSDGVTSADLAVLLQNEGLLLLGSLGTAGQVQATDFEQETAGVMAVKLSGTGLNDFDRLNLTGAASLSGELGLALFGGFVPALGQTFNIITATGGVTGSFTAVDQPAGMPVGLLFDVVYSPFIVQLQVVNGPIFSADFDVDGDVDGDDLDEWTASFGMDDGADADNDGDSDGADFLAWQQQLGSVPALPTGAAVPEPASAWLALLIAGYALGAGRLPSGLNAVRARPIRKSVTSGG